MNPMGTGWKGWKFPAALQMSHRMVSRDVAQPQGRAGLTMMQHWYHPSLGRRLL